MKRRPVRILIGVLAAVLVLVFALLLLAALPPGERLLASYLEGVAGDQLGVTVQIGSLRTNLVSRLQLQECLATQHTTERPDTLLRIPRLTVEYSIWNVLLGDISVELIDLDTLDVRLVRDSAGRFGISIIDTTSDSQTESSRTTRQFSIARIALGCVNVRYADVGLPLMLLLDDGNVRIVHESVDRYRFAMAAGNVVAEFDSLPIAVTDLRISGYLDSDYITIDSLTATANDLRCKADLRLGLDSLGSIRCGASLTGNAARSLAELKRYLELPELVAHGDLELSLFATGTLDRPQVHASIALPELAIDEVNLEDIAASAWYRADSLILDSLTVGKCLGGSLRCFGYTTLDSAATTIAHVLIQSMDVAALWGITYDTPSPYQGTINGEAQLGGSGDKLTDWDLMADVTADGLEYRGRRLPSINFHAAYAAGLGRLVLKQQDVQVAASLRIDDGMLDGSYSVSIPDLAPFAGIINESDAAGGIRASGTIFGALENPSLSAAIECSRIRYRDFPVDTLSATLLYRDSQVVLETCEASGFIQMSDTSGAPFGAVALTGELDYDISLRGTIGNPQGNLRAKATKLAFSNYTVDSLETHIDLDGSDINLTNAWAFSRNLSTYVTGSYNMEVGRGELMLTLHEVTDTTAGFPSAEDPAITELDTAGICSVWIELDSDSQIEGEISGRKLRLCPLVSIVNDSVNVQGLLDFDLHFLGDWHNPTGLFSFRTGTLTLPEGSLDSVLSHVTLSNSRLSVDSLRIYAYGQSAWIQNVLWLDRDSAGNLTITDRSRLQGRALINDFDISAFNSILMPSTEVSGTCSADIQWDGDLTSPRIRGEMTLSDGRVCFDTTAAPIDSIELELSLYDSVFVIDTLGAVVAGVPVDASGRATVHRSGVISLDVSAALPGGSSLDLNGYMTSESLDVKLNSGRFNLSVLQPFLKDVDSLQGSLSSELAIKGEAARPSLSGMLTVSDIGMTTPDGAVVLRHGFGAIQFDSCRILVDSLAAGLNDGRVFMRGHLTHDFSQVTDLALDIYAARLLFEEPELYTVTVDTAWLGYSRRPAGYVLEGDVQLGESRLTARFRPQAILPWARSVETAEWELPSMAEQTRLDIRIRESDNLWVDNNLARIRLRSELGAIGTVARPNFTGMVKIEEGYLIYLDRRFKINEGTIFFSDHLRFNPDIRLDASCQVSTYERMRSAKYTVFIRASGFLDQLETGLTSEPPLDKPDIVALLTLGATRKQLAGKDAEGEGGTKNVLLERAGMLTSQRVSGYVSGKVGSMFGFDEFTVQGNLFDFGGSWGPQLLASRKLSDRVELTYTTTVGRLNDQNVRLGYRLTSRLSLQGQTDRYGRAALDLKYAIRFR